MNLPAAMTMPAASLRSAALQLQALMLAVLVADVEGGFHVCPPFSCGAFSNISNPFRRQGDLDLCGPLELICTATSATIRIGSGTYYVVNINYSGSYFWVVDTNLSMQSSCPLPRSDYHAIRPFSWGFGLDYQPVWATFVNCSERINDGRYRPVRCLSTIDSFIYMFTGYNPASARNIKPSCGYLAMIPLGGAGMTVPEDASYEDVVKFMRKGFALSFSLWLMIEEYSPATFGIALHNKESSRDYLSIFFSHPVNVNRSTHGSVEGSISRQCALSLL
ncbi:hypothetical protein PR202_gb26653 [Eleusine coracana subsp. coracana]|uniref:Wall-associated receptor kinase galacturonan-binding domain-containing protein n=1 Tax=Eleusine coracana subsp. coracana TaxID=191504 RepID=A0AAV5FSC1_ELECO|nr:hypothetical protein PR202_gb26653 [Eleusine coracana subsp. coracana]